MHVVALVKHVPDVQSTRALTADGRLVRGGPDDTLNELDEDCLEAALRLVETAPPAADHDGETGHRDAPAVTALTVGPAAAVGALRRALAMGAAHGVHVRDDAVAGSDAVATAGVLAAAVQHIHVERRVDLVLAGMAALDGLTSVVPSALAALLGWPQLTMADRVAVGDGVVTVRRTTSHHVEELRASVPAVVSVTDQTYRPRSPGVRELLAARRRPVTVLGLADIGLSDADVGAAGSGTRVVEARPRAGRTGTVRLAGAPGTARELADLLAQRGFC